MHRDLGLEPLDVGALPFSLPGMCAFALHIHVPHAHNNNANVHAHSHIHTSTQTPTNNPVSSESYLSTDHGNGSALSRVMSGNPFIGDGIVLRDSNNNSNDSSGDRTGLGNGDIFAGVAIIAHKPMYFIKKNIKKSMYTHMRKHTYIYTYAHRHMDIP